MQHITERPNRKRKLQPRPDILQIGPQTTKMKSNRVLFAVFDPGPIPPPPGTKPLGVKEWLQHRRQTTGGRPWKYQDKEPDKLPPIWLGGQEEIQEPDVVARTPSGRLSTSRYSGAVARNSWCSLHQDPQPFAAELGLQGHAERIEQPNPLSSSSSNPPPWQLEEK